MCDSSARLIWFPFNDEVASRHRPLLSETKSSFSVGSIVETNSSEKAGTCRGSSCNRWHLARGVAVSTIDVPTEQLKKTPGSARGATVQFSLWNGWSVVSVVDREQGWGSRQARVSHHRCCHRRSRREAKRGNSPAARPSMRRFQPFIVPPPGQHRQVVPVSPDRSKPFHASFATQASSWFRRLSWSRPRPINTS